MKLAVPEGFVLPPLDGVAGCTAAAPTERIEHTVYWDTDDLAIARWGGCLRYRDTGVWTVKLRSGDERSGVNAEIMRRVEVDFSGEPSAPPEAALDVVSAFVRSGALMPVGSMSTRRTMVALHDSAGGAVAEVVNDAVTVMTGPNEGARFSEVEIELTGGEDEGVILAVAAHLREHGAGSAETMSKQRRVLGSFGPPVLDLIEGLPIPMGIYGLVSIDPLVRINADEATARDLAATAAWLRDRFADEPEGVLDTASASVLATLAVGGTPAKMLAIMRSNPYRALLSALLGTPPPPTLP